MAQNLIQGMCSTKSYTFTKSRITKKKLHNFFSDLHNVFMYTCILLWHNDMRSVSWPFSNSYNIRQTPPPPHTHTHKGFWGMRELITGIPDNLCHFFLPTLHGSIEPEGGVQPLQHRQGADVRLMGLLLQGHRKES